MKRKSREFVELQTKWYEILKEDGFEDLERFGANGEAKEILHHNVEIISPGKLARFSKIQDFYADCRRYYHVGRFKENEQDIWRLFMEGSSIRKISETFDVNRHKLMIIIHTHIRLMEHTTL